MGFGASTVFLNDIFEELLTLVPIADRTYEPQDQYRKNLCRALVGTTEATLMYSPKPIVTEAKLPQWHTLSTLSLIHI